MKIEDINRISADINERTEKEFLLSHTIYSDDFKNLSKEKQSELYRFCKSHAMNEICRENLKQMRYAIAELYFGF